MVSAHRLPPTLDRQGLILSDYMMPGMNGLELLHLYRQTLPPPHAPAILMTAALPPPALGMAHLITKPFNLEDLVAMVAEHVGSERVTV